MSLPDPREEFAVVADDSKELFQDTIAQQDSNGSAALPDQIQEGEPGQDRKALQCLSLDAQPNPHLLTHLRVHHA